MKPITVEDVRREREKAVEALRNDLMDFAEEYQDLFGMAPPLKVMNRRFGTQVKKITGVALKAYLSSLKGFNLTFNRDGQTIVYFERNEA